MLTPKPAVNRRDLIAIAIAGVGLAAIRPVSAQALPAPRAATAVPLGAFGLDATHLGLRPGSPDDQSRRLQEALVEAARRSAPLVLPPGRYRISNVIVPDGAQLVGVNGATVLAAAGAGPMLTPRRIRRASLSGLTLDGAGIRTEGRTGLIDATEVGDLSISQCELRQAGASGITLQRVAGRIEANRISGVRDTGLFSLDGRGLSIERNTIEDVGNNAIQLWREKAGDENAQVRGNRIARVRIDAGGDGPNGNGIVVFRAGGVIIEGNSFRDCALTFIRNNSSPAVQMLGNNGQRCGEVAYYAEFAFEGCVMANNIAEDCAQGFNITNLDHGGRLSVCSGNIVRRAARRLAPKGKELIGGFGIHVEAEAAVTGNVIEGASDVGISLGWSWGMRNLVATGNMVREAPVGIGVSLVPKERNVVIANNVIAGASRGAVVGFEYDKAVTGDLTRQPDRRAAGVRVEGNAVA
jgi:uncharacterized secreted repeat protein (TIGR03808 family)